MKKILTLCVAVAASLVTFAQNNVTDGRTVVPLGGLKTYTSDDETTSYTISNDDLQKITVAGNTANVYLFPENGALNTEANRAKGIQGFYIDLGTAKTISAVNTTWEGADAGGTVYVTNTEPAADGTLSDATAIATFTNAQEAAKDAAVTVENSGRYIVFVPSEATNYAWGVKIRTFVAYDNEGAVLTTFGIAPTFVAPNTPTTFTATLLDKAGSAMDGATYKIDGEAVASLEDISLAPGAHTVSATIGDVTLEQTVFAMNAPAAPAADDVFAAIYTSDSEGTLWEAVYNGGATLGNEITLGGQKVKSVSATKCVFFTNTNIAADIYNVNINPTASQYGKLRLDLFCGTAATGRVELEQTKTIPAATTFSLSAGEWKTIEIDLDGETFIKAMAIYTDNADDIAIANIYFTKAVEDETKDIVASMELTTTLIAKNTPTDLDITVKNAKGVALDASLYTLSADKGSFDAEGLFTATADGPITITATSTVEGSTAFATATVNTYPDPATTPEDDDSDVLAVYSDAYGAITYTPSDKGWNGGYGTQTEVALAAEDNAILVTDVVCFGINAGGQDITDYDFLNVAIYSDIAFEGHIQIEGTQMANLPVSLRAGQWNNVKVALSGTRTGATWIQMYVGAAETKNTIIVDNVYFSKLPAGTVIIADEQDAQGIRVVSGTITDANKSQVAALTDAAIDLSGAKIEASEVTVGNPNAIIIVAGEVGADNAATTTQTAVRGNRVVKNGAWYFPVEQIVIADTPAYPVWTGYFVSGNAAGWKYTRFLPANTYATLVVPGTIAVPEGIKAYSFKSVTDEGVKFEDTATLEANTPYLIAVGESDVNLEVSGNGDLNLQAPGTTEVDGVSFRANYVRQQLYDVYVLSSSSSDLTFFKAAGANVGAFRAYLSFTTMAPSNIKVDLGDDLIDGIGTLATSEATSSRHDSAIYSLSGQRVQRATKGIYVVGGKKVLVK